MHDDSFLDVGALSGSKRNGLLVLAWPVPGNRQGLKEFASAPQWQTFLPSPESSCWHI